MLIPIIAFMAFLVYYSFLADEQAEQKRQQEAKVKAEDEPTDKPAKTAA